jgi:colicin import membrane protein
MRQKNGTVRLRCALTAGALLMMITMNPATIAVEPAVAASDAAHYIGQRHVSVREYVRARASRAGWGYREWRALAEIIRRESSWNPQAANDHSTAFGLFQILRMNPETPLRKQVEAGIRYIRERYGLPSVALAHHNRFGWY